jgi:hypothetical protein
VDSNYEIPHQQECGQSDILMEFYFMVKYFVCYVRCKTFKHHTIITWHRDGNWSHRYGDCIVCGAREIR